MAENIVAKTAQQAAAKLLRASINGRSILVPLGATILDACKAVGAHVPTLCHHPSFEPATTCRLCLVEVNEKDVSPDAPHIGPSGKRAAVRAPSHIKLYPACRTKVADGMIIMTNTPQLREFRKKDLQFLLAKHPNECMRCEASGHCKLQDLVAEYNVEELWPKSSRVITDPVPEHLIHDHTSPAIQRDMDKCIECGLCVKACAEQQIHAIGFVGRGIHSLPTTVFDKPLSETNCISCGQCTFIHSLSELIAEWLMTKY